jgi:hypothetical protein
VESKSALVNIPDNVGWPLFLIGTIMQNYTSWKTEHHHILFALGFTTILIRWIGRRRQSEWQSRSPNLTPCNLFVWSWTKNDLSRSKSRTTDEPEQQIWDNLSLFHLTFQGKALSLCLPGCRNVCKMMGPILRYELKWYTNIPFLLGQNNHLILSTYFTNIL